MGSKILVVEDSRAFRNYLQQQFTQAGYDVYLAASLTEMNQLLSENEHFLSAILDYCLPDGEDGEVIDLALRNNLKVIVLTAMLNEEIRTKVLAKGVIDYILKDSMASVAYLIPLIKRLSNNQQHWALVVDDSKLVRKHITQLLEHQYIKTLEAANGEEALVTLAQHPKITFIITDHDMPKKDGITMIREIRMKSDKNKLAILGLSGSDDRTMTARFLKAGANDFLYKPFNQEEFYCRVHQILDMKEAASSLYQMANQDVLTGLWNRRYLFEHAYKDSQTRHIAMVDIDHFKKVNDTYGHDGGDMALKAVSNILKIYFPTDIVARLGGEEFCIQSHHNYHDFIRRLEKMRQRVEQTPITHKEHIIHVTVSIGVSSLHDELSNQIKEADSFLYQAKAGGRNRLVSK